VVERLLPHDPFHFGCRFGRDAAVGCVSANPLERERARARESAKGAHERSAELRGGRSRTHHLVEYFLWGA
jgi:hypothetical protein